MCEMSQASQSGHFVQRSQLEKIDSANYSKNRPRQTTVNKQFLSRTDKQYHTYYTIGPVFTDSTSVSTAFAALKRR
jgi:hypothetical protein